jgi:mono/diheme cytochrome c family protein
VSRRAVMACVVLAVCAACRVDSRADHLGAEAPEKLGLGHPATAAEIAAVDIDATPNGVGLPAGRGTPEQGATIYAAQCASCHGVNGEGKPPYPQLLGGPKGNFNFATDFKIPKTIGNYWPYATTLFDYVRRAMPLMTPGSLTADETYAVTAYLLNREGILPAGTAVDAKALVAVQMPARQKFVEDDRKGSPGGAKTR